MKSEQKRILVRVFTHPVCTSCHLAIEMAQDLSEQRDDVEVRIVSLANQAGIDEARNENVLSLPTVIVGRSSNRFIGVPKREDFSRAVHDERQRLMVSE